jgi:hypothetical protein
MEKVESSSLFTRLVRPDHLTQTGFDSPLSQNARQVIEVESTRRFLLRKLKSEAVKDGFRGSIPRLPKIAIERWSAFRPLLKEARLQNL